MYSQFDFTFSSSSLFPSFKTFFANFVCSRQTRILCFNNIEVKCCHSSFFLIYKRKILRSQVKTSKHDADEIVIARFIWNYSFSFKYCVFFTEGLDSRRYLEDFCFSLPTDLSVKQKHYIVYLFIFTKYLEDTLAVGIKSDNTDTLYNWFYLVRKGGNFLNTKIFLWIIQYVRSNSGLSSLSVLSCRFSFPP